MDTKAVGAQISILRRNKGLTQSDLGQRLGVSFQAVSKWERGETLPDTALLPDLAEVLESSVDHILSGGKKLKSYRGRITVTQIREGLTCLKRMGELLGKESSLYRLAVNGINCGMNTDIELAFRDEALFECFLAEAILDLLAAGRYIDVTDVKTTFHQEQYRSIVLARCEEYGLR